MRNSGTQLAARLALALPLLCGPMLPAHAGEMADRKEIAELFTRSFTASEFSTLDTWYSQARRDNSRLPSGDFRADRLVQSIAFGEPPAVRPCTEFRCFRANDAYWLAQQQKARVWLGQHPQSTLAALTLAKAYDAQAWEYRGAGFANNVREEDMLKFRHLANQAVQTLFTHAEHGRKDPNWWSQLLTYSRYTPRGQKNLAKLAHDALAAFPGNPGIYASLADSLTPQWGGSYEAIAGLAAHAVDNTEAEEGQSMYARVYWSAYGLLSKRGTAVFARPDVNWPRIRAGFDDLVQRYPDSTNLNTYARLACISALDKKTTARLLQRIAQEIEPQVWESRSEFMRCKNWSREETP